MMESYYHTDDDNVHIAGQDQLIMNLLIPGFICIVCICENVRNEGIICIWYGDIYM